MKYLWNAWPGLEEKFLRSYSVVLFIDFDGTLVPISTHPSKAKMGKAMKTALQRLSENERCRVVVISGRAVKNLKQQLRMPKLIYVGNHGMEIKGGKGISRFSDNARASKIKKAVRKVKGLVSGLIRPLDGVWLEDKGYSISIHYRNMASSLRLQFRKKMQDLKNILKDWPVVLRKGKKVLELRHKDARDKGFAVTHLLRQFSGFYPVAVGDDHTDEDMFEVLKMRGTTVRVRPRRSSKASYYLKSVGEVRIFLEHLWHLLE